MKTKSAISGYSIEKENGVVTRVSTVSRSVNLGARVISNGNFMPEGVSGVVDELIEPYTDNRTSDFIGVRLDGEAYTTWMKFEDLV